MNERRDRGRWGGNRRDEQPAARRPEPRRDAGAYIGRKPERATETIPGGVQHRDERVSAVATQPAPVRPDTGPDTGAPPAGHREVSNATDATQREAGEKH